MLIVSHLYHLRYPTEDGTDYIEVATTRPETMLGRYRGGCPPRR